MVHIKCKKGLDLPIEGEPTGEARDLEANGRKIIPKKIALNLSCFENIRFKLLRKKGESVRIGEPLVTDKSTPGRHIVAPASGVISEIQRGEKRRFLNIIIDLDETEEVHELPKMDPQKASRAELTERMLEGGLFAHIWQRPFHRLADPGKPPRDIFVKAIESAPFVAPPEMQVKGHEEAFQVGLDALINLTEGSVHLVHRKGSDCKAFTEAKGVEIHTAEGMHPVGTHSLHIHEISPIQSHDESLWIVNVFDVIAIGHHLKTGRPLLESVIGLGGGGTLPEMRGYFKVRVGMSIQNLISGRIPHEKMRLISGNVLSGEEVSAEGYLGFFHHAFSVIPEPEKRQFLHFFRLGIDKFTASRTYFSGLFGRKNHRYPFTTSKHGEHRFFITNTPYDAVMPMRIPTMHLVKAVMAEDFDLAEELGLLEVAPEDFCLPTFVCPSKIEMVEIMKKGLNQYAAEVLG